MPDYPSAVAELLAVDHPTSLGPGAPAAGLRAKIKAAASLLPPACAAGLWLRFDFLDESHAISQEDEGNPDRDFWHGVMHRREPDASNAKYWFRRVGHHPVMDQLQEKAPAIGYNYTNPFDFVDFCERVRDTRTAEEELGTRVQLLEWQLLFDHCYQTATGV